MSLYFRLVDEDLEDLEKYEIGAFVGDECRGLAEKLELTGGESCLYMRIRSNESSGESVDFLLRDKQTGDTVIVKPKDGSAFLFKSGSRVGMPSDPFVMARFYNVVVKTEGKGSVKFTDGLYAAGTVLDLTAVAEEGYHFVEWSNGSTDEAINVNVDADIDLTASFAPNIYEATFTIVSDTHPFEETINVACGDTIVAPKIPVIEGLTFSGWNDLPEVMPAHDIAVSGVYELGIYKLVFKIDGETVEEAELEFGKTITLPEAPAKEGYKFDGWANVPATMPSHDVEIHSSYTVQSYPLVFKIGEDVLLSEDIAYGTSIVAPDAPAKDGYSFSGWSGVPETMPAAPLTLTGSYSINSYLLTFKVDGVEVSSAQVEFGAPVSAPEAEEKTGYTFNGWGLLPETMPSHDVEIHGNYSVNSYYLTFMVDDKELEKDTVSYGASIIAPSIADKEGYTFSGWDKKIPATMPAENLVFSGKYDVNTYKVVYKLDGEVAFEAEAAFGASVPTFTAPDKSGFAFEGWSQSDIPAVMPARDLEFNGSYIVNEFELTYKIGEEIISSNKVIFGTEITAPEAPAKEGYTFTGWNKDLKVMPNEDVVVEGAYKINTYKITYTVENEDFGTQEYEYGAPVTALAEPTQEGHTFSGWGDVPATMPAHDLTFGGTFAENFYRVTFRIDGTVLFTDDVEYGTPVTAPEAPAKEGYTFNGWGEIPTAMPAYDLEYDGSYTINRYPITFKIGDDVVYYATLEYGASIESPAAPEKEGHSFSGWGVVPAVMPASELEITGDYTVNSYNLVFRIGEEDFSTTQVKFGEAITAPEAPAKEGHTFSGWSELPASMPASDLLITGVYNVNSYALSFKIGNDEIFKGDIPFGMVISAPEAPLKEGHTFAGWGMVPKTMPAYDLEVNGSYDVNVYNLSYLIDGGNFSTTQIAYGSQITAPEAPAKEGHTFLGWSDAVATMPASDLVISGTYAVNNYNIEFKIGDDSIYKGVLPYGTSIVAPEGPLKEGHTFAGWGMVPSVMPAKDLTFDGSYTVNIYKLIFDIDGEDFYTTQLAYGSDIVAPAEVPDKEGHSFEGWGNVPATVPANDLRISGTYSPNHYTLTFKIGEDVYFTGEQPYGSVIEEPATPVKEGYTFAGWEKYPETVPAENVEVNGSFTINQYKVEFVIKDYDANGDKVVESYVRDFGEPVTIPEVDNTRTGYTFSGFGVVPATVPASDVVYTGEFVVNYYTLT
ncbi:MAG: InlB B-repeat-containing protein, partial [Muribaculaceae bacterium]|nr:InlB B-repeat-containing protein [Muribaculaceae bacterium]